MNASCFNEVEGDVDIFEALNTKFGFGGIAAEGLIAENFEEVDENDLW